jgi:hypothetical protein
MGLRARLITLMRQLYGPYIPYQSIHFTEPIEASYQVAFGQLLPETGKFVRDVDQQLFNLFTETLGMAAVAPHVAEWRIFHDEEGSIDAYVEQIAGTATYVVNVNRFGFDINKEADRQTLRELFVHEYAHLLFIARPLITETYQEVFWNTADHRASAGTSFDQARHYSENEHRFVSEYATQSVDEDMAETFLYAVQYSEELSSGVRQDKYNFLMDIPWVRSEILRLRANLN